MLLGATVGLLVFTTGGAFSSFISAWMIIVVFAAVFGPVGMALAVLSTTSYVLYSVILSKYLPVEEIFVAVTSTLVPLVAGYIIFHSKSKKDHRDSAYYSLANELSAANSQSDIVIQAIDDGVLSINAKGVIQLINPAAQDILGWGHNDAVGLSYESVLKLSTEDKRTPGETENPVSVVLSTNKDSESDKLYATTGGGKRILLSLVVSPIGQVGDGAIVVFRDITKEYAKEKEKAEFISTASHEMRTPVASIEGYLGLALNPNTAQIDSKARDYITKAHESAQHLGRLFQDLLDVSKAEDGRLSNHPTVIDVVDFLFDVVEGLRSKATDKNLRLYYKPRPTTDPSAQNNRFISPVLYANVDSDHLRELVSNLVENAIKYTPSGDVIVDATADDDIITISVQDSGIGIAKEDMPHLFQKFYRIDNSATREIGGTGLGLYLCRRLSEVMDGRLWIESELGKGSTFHLEIPRLEQTEAMHLLETESGHDETGIQTHSEKMLPTVEQLESMSTPIEDIFEPQQPTQTQQTIDNTVTSQSPQQELPQVSPSQAQPMTVVNTSQDNPPPVIQSNPAPVAQPTALDNVYTIRPTQSTPQPQPPRQSVNVQIPVRDQSN